MLAILNLSCIAWTLDVSIDSICHLKSNSPKIYSIVSKKAQERNYPQMFGYM